MRCLLASPLPRYVVVITTDLLGERPFTRWTSRFGLVAFDVQRQSCSPAAAPLRLRALGGRQFGRCPLRLAPVSPLVRTLAHCAAAVADLPAPRLFSPTTRSACSQSTRPPASRSPTAAPPGCPRHHATP